MIERHVVGSPSRREPRAARLFRIARDDEHVVFVVRNLLTV
jgi:hypothetical protein